ncbi:hypothetical protein [Bacillus phage CM1]|nr:hypothetical protein [Bacillus phage CM1]
MEELIKKQIEIEKQIEALQDKSDEIGEGIFAKFEKMHVEKMKEVYCTLPPCPSKYKIFTKFIYPLIK